MSLTSPRLAELLRMRRDLDRTCDFVDAEIATERRRLASDPVERTILAAADLYSVTTEDVLGHSRAAGAVKARHLAAWMLRQRGMAFTEIGSRLARDHTTVIYACRAIESQPAVKRLAEGLLAQEDAA